MKTHSAKIKQELLKAGFSVEKQKEHKQWGLFDKQTAVFYSNSLGDLLRRAESEFGL